MAEVTQQEKTELLKAVADDCVAPEGGSELLSRDQQSSEPLAEPEWPQPGDTFHFIGRGWVCHSKPDADGFRMWGYADGSGCRNWTDEEARAIRDQAARQASMLEKLEAYRAIDVEALVQRVRDVSFGSSPSAGSVIREAFAKARTKEVTK